MKGDIHSFNVMYVSMLSTPSIYRDMNAGYDLVNRPSYVKKSSHLRLFTGCQFALFTPTLFAQLGMIIPSFPSRGADTVDGDDG